MAVVEDNELHVTPIIDLEPYTKDMMNINLLSITDLDGNTPENDEFWSFHTGKELSKVTLSALTVNPGILKPFFTSETTEYSVEVSNDVESVNAVAVLLDDNASLTINGEVATSGEAKEITLSAAGTETAIDVVVTAEDYSTAKTYTVIVSRAEKEPPTEVGAYKVGLYDPADGVFHLKIVTPFCYGPRVSNWLPVSGDWNGDGTVSVGLYDHLDGIFHLRGESPFRYGPRNLDWLPVSGRW